MRSQGSRQSPAAAQGEKRPMSRARMLGAAVRGRRKQLGLTQRALCRYAGCGLAFLYQLEHGKPSARMDKVLDVLEVLGLELRVEPGKDGVRVGAAVGLTEEPK